MKKKWIYIAVAALVVGGAVATAMAHKGNSGRRMHRAMMVELELSDEQKEQLTELHAEQRKALQALHESDERPDREAVKARFANHRAAMAKILTPEQNEKMEAMRGEWAFGGGEMRGHRDFKGHRGGEWGRGFKGRHGEHRMGGPERGGHVLAMLDLSDEQKGEIKELRKEQRGKMKEMRQKHQKSIEKVLSKEQREKLEELKDEVFYGRGRRGGHGGRGW